MRPINRIVIRALSVTRFQFRNTIQGTDSFCGVRANSLLKWIAGAACGLLLSNCATRDKEATRIPAPTTREDVISQQQLHWEKVGDYLDLFQSSDELGVRSTRFNSCKLPEGIKDNAGACKSLRFYHVRFQLLCRASEGTVEYVSASELSPIETEFQNWKLGGLNGRYSTNSDGVGELQLASKNDPIGSRLILFVGAKYVGLRLTQLRENPRVVLPGNWCE